MIGIEVEVAIVTGSGLVDRVVGLMWVRRRIVSLMLMLMLAGGWNPLSAAVGGRCKIAWFFRKGWWGMEARTPRSFRCCRN